MPFASNIAAHWWLQQMRSQTTVKPNHPSVPFAFEICLTAPPRGCGSGSGADTHYVLGTESELAKRRVLDTNSASLARPNNQSRQRRWRWRWRRQPEAAAVGTELGGMASASERRDANEAVIHEWWSIWGPAECARRAPTAAVPATNPAPAWALHH